MLSPRRIRSPVRVALAAAALGPVAMVAMVATAQAPVATAQTAAAAESPQVRRGRLLYIQCRACHEVAAGQPHRVGPNLHGFLGQPAASRAGFNYSAALRDAKLAWDRDTLDRWLERPAGLVPGNTMAFVGVPRAEDRAALIAYLEAATAR
jgi:cytochrome c